MKLVIGLIMGLIMLIAILIWNSGPAFDSGEVVATVKNPAHFVNYTTYIHVGNGTSIPQFHNDYYPESYTIFYSNGKNITKYNVDKRFFDRIQIGDRFSVTEYKSKN